MEITQREIIVHNTEGKLYYICPFLRKITALVTNCYEKQINIDSADLFEIMRHSESIKTIAKHLRGEDKGCEELLVEKIYKPYNFSAAIKTMKTFASKGELTEEKIEEILKQYF